jgi:CRP-like cAMP-binding protein
VPESTSLAHSLRRQTERLEYIAPFLHRHRSIVSFDEHERALLESSAALSHSFDCGATIRRQTDVTTSPSIVASGWACYARSTRNGRRQIFSFILPGDSIGLAKGPFARGFSEILALTDVVLLDASNIQQALAESHCSNLRMAFYLERGLQEARLLDLVVQLGQQSSLERTAHLLLELHHRMDRAGLVRNERFHLPLTQHQIGAALGLSQIQMHRTLQALRSRGLLVLNGREATLPNVDELEQAAGYEVRPAGRWEIGKSSPNAFASSDDQSSHQRSHGDVAVVEPDAQNKRA